MNTPEEELSDEQRLADLTEKAERKGFSLRQMHSGYILSKGTHSWHFSDLRTAAALLKR